MVIIFSEIFVRLELLTTLEPKHYIQIYSDSIPQKNFFLKKYENTLLFSFTDIKNKCCVP